MYILDFNLDYFLQFELTNLLKLIKIGFYAFLIVFFIVRMHVRKKDGNPYQFEIFVALFFLFMCVGSIWEVFCLVFDPIFFHSGTLYYYELNFLPTGFNGMALVFFLGYIGFGFFSLGLERGSNLPTKGMISIIPFSYSITLLIWGIQILNMPWFAFSFSVAIIPLLFFYIAIKSEDEIRNKALLQGVGILIIFTGEALNINLWIKYFPEVVGYIMYGIFRHPIYFYLPLVAIIGCIFLIIGQILYKD